MDPYGDSIKLDYFERMLSGTELSAINTMEDNNILQQCFDTIKQLFPSDPANDEQQTSSFISRNMIVQSDADIKKCPVKINKRHRRSIEPSENLDDFSLPPIHTKLDFIRVKRTAIAQLHRLEEQYSRCSRTAGRSCGHIYERYRVLVKEVNKKLEHFAEEFNFPDDEDSVEIKKLLKKNSKNEKENAVLDDKFMISSTTMKVDGTSPSETTTSTKSTSFDWMSSVSKFAKDENSKITEELDPPARGQDPIKQSIDMFEHISARTRFGDGFYYTYKEHPRVHEELIDDYTKYYKNNLDSTHKEDKLRLPMGNTVTSSQKAGVGIYG